jgi:Domain of Unknown Function (DUF1080)
MKNHYSCFRCITLAAWLVAGSVIAGLAWSAQDWFSGKIWPEPKLVDPGPLGGRPVDAVVLFDGKDVSAFRDSQQWEVRDGAVTAGGNDIRSKQPFGDCQLHLEFATPAVVKGDGQARGNSGVFLMDRYELQIMDSYNNKTYYDGQCGAIYKQHPPLVNACRPPGEWQTYDIVFTAPRFDDKGNVAQPAYITAFQNGVLIQDHFAIEGSTAYDRPPLYTAHPVKVPLRLQYHSDPVRFRNIWIRELTPMNYSMDKKD